MQSGGCSGHCAWKVVSPLAVCVKLIQSNEGWKLLSLARQTGLHKHCTNTTIHCTDRKRKLFELHLIPKSPSLPHRQPFISVTPSIFCFLSLHTHTHTHTHTLPYTHTYTHAHTHIHTQSFPYKTVDLLVTFPAEYPSIPFSAELPNDQGLPPTIIAHGNQIIADHVTSMYVKGVSTGLPFRPFLRWLDKNLQEIFHEGSKKVCTEYVSCITQASLSAGTVSGCQQ